ncbi:MAG: class I SAM-dependent methyltransferase, partial [Desulfobulbaceae bacterium]|nr:class I SAM-dependent methyltransferase [Desulfobulbaceae bacterium]
LFYWLETIFFERSNSDRLLANSKKPEQTADSIINDYLSSEEAYKNAAQKENEIWGKIFSDPKREKIVSAEQKAATDLGLNRNHISLFKISEENGWKFDKGLSLACGNGRAERRYIDSGFCKSFVGIDISHQAIKIAKEIATESNLNIDYFQGDLNDLVLEQNSFDIVITQNCLHHVLRLEHLVDQIYYSIKPGGYLWIHDYIGETQFQYTDERLMIANFVLNKIPERYRKDRLKNGKILKKITRKKPGTLRSPFEAIRSGMILPIFLKRFELTQKHEYNAILHLICPKGTRIEYAKDEDGRSLFEKLYQLDRILIESNMLPPTGGQFLLRRP